MRDSCRIRRVASVVAISLAALVSAPGSAGAQPAQSIDDLRSQARAIAKRIEALQTRADHLDEAYLTARAELESLKEKLAQKQADVAAAQAELEQNQSLAKQYVVTAFTADSNVDPVLQPAGDAAETSLRAQYVTSLQGDRTQVVEDIRGARAALEQQQAELDAAKSQVDKKVATLDSTRQEVRSIAAQQVELKNSVDSRLAAEVKAEQERLEAARAAAARKQAEEDAARAAAAAARPRASVPAMTTNDDDSAEGQQRLADSALAGLSPTPGAAAAIAAARSQLGVPYHWGESDPGDGFDCSGLTMYAWAAGGISLPHSSRAQYSMTERITADQLQPGDLVFGGSPVHHVGLYIGNGMMIHAPHSGDVVRVSSIYDTSSPVTFGHLSG